MDAYWVMITFGKKKENLVLKLQQSFGKIHYYYIIYSYLVLL